MANDGERVQALQAMCQELNNRLSTQETEMQRFAAAHAALHIELMQLQAAHRVGSRAVTSVDPKAMAPPRFGGKGGPTWRVWLIKSRKWVARLNQLLEPILQTIDGSIDQIEISDLTTLGVTTDEDAQIRCFLYAQTEDEAFEIV